MDPVSVCQHAAHDQRGYGCADIGGKVQYSHQSGYQIVFRKGQWYERQQYAVAAIRHGGYFSQQDDGHGHHMAPGDKEQTASDGHGNKHEDKCPQFIALEAVDQYFGYEHTAKIGKGDDHQQQGGGRELHAHGLADDGRTPDRDAFFHKSQAEADQTIHISFMTEKEAHIFSECTDGQLLPGDGWLVQSAIGDDPDDQQDKTKQSGDQKEAVPYPAIQQTSEKDPGEDKTANHG